MLFPVPSSPTLEMVHFIHLSSLHSTSTYSKRSFGSKVKISTFAYSLDLRHKTHTHTHKNQPTNQTNKKKGRSIQPIGSGFYPAHQNNSSSPILALQVMRQDTEMNCSRCLFTKHGQWIPALFPPLSCNLSCVHHMTKRQVLPIRDNTILVTSQHVWRLSTWQHFL